MWTLSLGMGWSSCGLADLLAAEPLALEHVKEIVLPPVPVSSRTPGAERGAG